MDYEKKYKEALEKARQLCAYPTTKPFISDLQDLFPELKESEDEDEKIRKELIRAFKSLNTIKVWNGIERTDIIAWLEKQGQKETVWNNEYDKDMLGAIEYCIKNNRPLEKEHIAWLEKHGKSNPYSGVSFEYNGNIWGMCARDNGVDIILNRELIQHISIEKQGEQKSKNESTDTCDSLIIKNKEFPASEKRDFGYFSETADKVEPKFKVGDWIVDSIDTVCQIKEIEEDRYLLEFYNSNGVIPVKISIIDNDCHLWTIQDAKDGDVLEFSDHGRLVVGIVSHVNKTTGKVDVNCLLEYNNFKVGNYYNLDTIKPHPATKEQRDTLIKAMADAGYTFDFKKKKLNKIESDLTEFENTLADVCRGWIGEELGWKDYIIKNSLPLLELAKKQFDEYEQKPAESSDIKSVLLVHDEILNNLLERYKTSATFKTLIVNLQNWWNNTRRHLLSFNIEQKPADKVKFKVGDWITNGDYTWKIIEVKPLDYILQSQDGNIVDDTISHVDEQFHSFTIEDAKDGDVLACESGWTCIFKSLNDATFSSYCFMDRTKSFFETGSECHTLKEEFIKAYNGEIRPATKEQRDTLFAKMKEAGYEWDAEKKKLEKIEDKRPLLSDFFKAEYERGKADAQKSAWSEEDERERKRVVGLLEGWMSTFKETYYAEDCKRGIDWLKSLKQRYTWKPSEEQMIALRDVISGCSYDIEPLVELETKLKEL